MNNSEIIACLICKINKKVSGSMYVAMVEAMFSDLIEHGYIEVIDGNVLLKAKECEINYLNDLLRFIAKSSKVQRLDYWIKYLCTGLNNKLLSKLMHQLLSDILQKSYGEGEKNYIIYDQTILRIREEYLNLEKINKAMGNIVSIAYRYSLLNAIYSKKMQKQYIKEIDLLNKECILGAALKEMMLLNTIALL